MKKVRVFEVIVGNLVHYSCLSYDEAEDYGTAYYGEKDKDFTIEDYDHQTVDHTQD